MDFVQNFLKCYEICSEYKYKVHNTLKVEFGVVIFKTVETGAHVNSGTRRLCPYSSHASSTWRIISGMDFLSVGVILVMKCLHISNDPYMNRNFMILSFSTTYFKFTKKLSAKYMLKGSTAVNALSMLYSSMSCRWLTILSMSDGFEGLIDKYRNPFKFRTLCSVKWLLWNVNVYKPGLKKKR
jgi:hypothetical protein